MQAKEAMNDINPNTLKLEIIYIYMQVIYMLPQFVPFEKDFYQNKTQEI